MIYDVYRECIKEVRQSNPLLKCYEYTMVWLVKKNWIG